MEKKFRLEQEDIKPVKIEIINLKEIASSPFNAKTILVSLFIGFIISVLFAFLYDLFLLVRNRASKN